MTSRQPLATWNFAAVLVLGASLAGGCGCNTQPELKPVTSTSRATLKVAGRDILVELQTDAESRASGLMFRTHLDDDKGMLFVFPEDQMLTFYMRNTLIPLDIVFLHADGTVMNITHGTPGVEIPTCNSDAPARLVLELNAGWCAQNGLKPGDRVLVPPEVLPLGH